MDIVDKISKINHFPVMSRTHQICISCYKQAEGGEWAACPKCGLKPMIWEFDNGRFTACGCANNRYSHFTIRAESINSVASRCNGNVSEYDSDALRKEWNRYCAGGIENEEELFKAQADKDGNLIKW
jgi:ssDNA-binding Zn-finger/Zn-ribbon topoisomerase 1